MEHYAGIDVALEQSSVCVVDGVIGNAKLTQLGSMNLTHRRRWLLHDGGADAEGGGADGVGGLEEARDEHSGAGTGDGALTQHGAALPTRWRRGGDAEGGA